MFGVVLKRLGYSLIEMLIVLMLIAVLSTFAVHQYESLLIKSYRMAAQADLHKLAAALNEYRLTHFGKGFVGADESTVFLRLMKPLKNHPYYDFDVFISSTGVGYLLVGTPKEDSLQADDGLLSLNQLGMGCWLQTSHATKAGDLDVIQQCLGGKAW